MHNKIVHKCSVCGYMTKKNIKADCVAQKESDTIVICPDCGVSASFFKQYQGHEKEENTCLKADIS